MDVTISLKVCNLNYTMQPNLVKVGRGGAELAEYLLRMFQNTKL